MTIKIDALSEAIAKLEQQAPRTRAHIIKSRARLFARMPWQLSSIEPIMPELSPKNLIAHIECLLLWERSLQRRWYGFGGESVAMNILGAMLYARYARFVQHVMARKRKAHA